MPLSTPSLSCTSLSHVCPNLQVSTIRFDSWNTDIRCLEAFGVSSTGECGRLNRAQVDFGRTNINRHYLPAYIAILHAFKY